ncbi:hypothetical protein HDZ31DRAFT_78635, partial [Schizophyllum fasciatum]
LPATIDLKSHLPNIPDDLLCRLSSHIASERRATVSQLYCYSWTSFGDGSGRNSHAVKPEDSDIQIITWGPSRSPSPDYESELDDEADAFERGDPPAYRLPRLCTGTYGAFRRPSVREHAPPQIPPLVLPQTPPPTPPPAPPQNLPQTPLRAPSQAGAPVSPVVLLALYDMYASLLSAGGLLLQDAGARIRAELDQIALELIYALRTELGLGDRDLASLTFDARLKLVDVCRAYVGPDQAGNTGVGADCDWDWGCDNFDAGSRSSSEPAWGNEATEPRAYGPAGVPPMRRGHDDNPMAIQNLVSPISNRAPSLLV